MANDNEWLADEEGNLNPDAARLIAPEPLASRVQREVSNAPTIGDVVEGLGRGFLQSVATIGEELARLRQARAENRAATARARRRRQRRLLRICLLFIALLGLLAGYRAYRATHQWAQGTFYDPGPAAARGRH
jgi:hypothetical protein